MLSPVEHIVRFRRRDVFMVLPFTLVAAAGAMAWLPGPDVFAWLTLNLVLVCGGQLFYANLLRGAEPRLPPPAVLAASTFITTAIYAVLPAELLMQGSHGAAVAALAMTAAIALSSTSEFVESTLVGAGSLSALFLATLIAITVSMRAESRWSVAVALIADTCFFAYVVGHALNRRKVEHELRDARRAAEDHALRAQAANAAKSDFLATMSHEIRTPLNGVIGMAQVMSGDELSDLQRERLGVVRQSGEALLVLLNDVLDLAKIEAGKLECEAEPFDLHALLCGLEASFSAIAEGKGIGLQLSLSPAAAGVYRGDPARIRQIVANLLSNAVKFTDAGLIRLAVDCDPADAPYSVVRLAVSDTGIGMPADRLDRLFGKFSQLDASTTRRYGGTGLGLAISRQLAEKMGGSIVAESRLGAGSTFTATLKLERLADTALIAETQGDTPVAVLDPDAPFRVLAAEDNAVNRLVLKTLLEQAGIQPVLVDNGAEAVAAWADGDWDVILMDVQMPIMDGVQAARAIRAREREQRRPRTPIIALTANAMSHQLLEYDAAEMDDCVSKPIQAEALFLALQRVIEASAAGAAEAAA
jgi:signal transduction histidine kinase